MISPQKTMSAAKIVSPPGFSSPQGNFNTEKNHGRISVPLILDSTQSKAEERKHIFEQSPSPGKKSENPFESASDNMGGNMMQGSKNKKFERKKKKDARSLLKQIDELTDNSQMIQKG